ncbi:MAG: MBL fold metallo-hydrolase [Pirellulaceae bacterium]|nr:MBL fold metallo-hydrolase [Pirellulaceae bacterium]
MVFVLETIFTDGIAQLSYLVGDTETGHAAVIDPRTDSDIYLQKAREHGLSITHVMETHIHADFVSGSCSLIDHLSGAKLYVSGEQADYQFDAVKVQDGDTFDFGSFVLTARHTPGHTPEHISYEVAESESPDQPWGVFTGDSLFVGSAGRPDLLGDGQTEELTEQLYHTLYDYYLQLDDHVIIHPGHGAGSACGADIGDRLVSSIGYERRKNKFLRFPDFQQFRDFVVDEAPPAPDHYPLLKKVNGAGPEIMHRLPQIAALPPTQFRKASREPGVAIIDARSILAFGGGHIHGAISIADRPEMSAWVGQLFDLDRRLLLIVDDDCDVESVQRLIVRTGHSRFAGYLAGGMTAWETAGLPMQTLPQLTVQELHEHQSGNTRLHILDVRSPQEFESGHIPGAEHYFIADMKHRIDGLDKTKRYATYCASGYRASIAASLMQSRGFEKIATVPGSWKAWMAANYPVAKAS